jgi:APA family basic amino acid/polyamine antiporter
MVMVFVINYLAPKLPMKLNVATTAARLIPLVLMGTAGVIFGFVTQDNINITLNSQPLTLNIQGQSFLGAVFATVFAYNGWQAAVAFNSEVKNSKRNFPIALLTGFLVVMVIYVLYFIGMTKAGDINELMTSTPLGTRNAFVNIFGAPAGSILLVFIIISGLGILNMCCMGMSRSLYSLARRGLGPVPHRMVQLDTHTGVPVCSMVTCLCVSFLWLGVIFGNHNGWFGSLNGRPFRFDLPDFYNMNFFILLIPIFAGFIARNGRNRDFSRFNRVVAPILAIGGAGFMVFTLIQSSPVHAGIYFGVFVSLALIGFIFYGKRG